ncbi:MAG: Flp family type IVb pilin [Deltaproteobacteria bacterium]|nr:Flp family type IVb pilin [Deltaproteobacteria bacterium]
MQHTGLNSTTSRRGQRGQGMTEYIIIVALIAIGTIVFVTVFGDNIRALFGTAANSLAGQPGTIEGQTVNESDTKRDLKNFGEAP